MKTCQTRASRGVTPGIIYSAMMLRSARFSNRIVRASSKICAILKDIDRAIIIRGSGTERKNESSTQILPVI